jgi:hypothetical protein
MAISTTTDTAFLGTYQQLLQNLVSILDKEATIDVAVRTLTDANIAQLNQVVSDTLTSIDNIVNPLV